MENMKTSKNCAPYQLFDVLADPSERSDLYGQPQYDSIVSDLKALYAAERAVAVYPCIRGPSGRPNSDGVLQPWLTSKDKCEDGTGGLYPPGSP